MLPVVRINCRTKANHVTAASNDEQNIFIFDCSGREFKLVIDQFKIIIGKLLV